MAGNTTVYTYDNSGDSDDYHLESGPDLNGTFTILDSEGRGVRVRSGDVYLVDGDLEIYIFARGGRPVSNAPVLPGSAEAVSAIQAEAWDGIRDELNSLILRLQRQDARQTTFRGPDAQFVSHEPSIFPGLIEQALRLRGHSAAYYKAWHEREKGAQEDWRQRLEVHDQRSWRWSQEGLFRSAFRAGRYDASFDLLANPDLITFYTHNTDASITGIELPVLVWDGSGDAQLVSDALGRVPGIETTMAWAARRLGVTEHEIARVEPSNHDEAEVYYLRFRTPDGLEPEHLKAAFIGVLNEELPERPRIKYHWQKTDGPDSPTYNGFYPDIWEAVAEGSQTTPITISYDGDEMIEQKIMPHKAVIASADQNRTHK